MLDKMEEKADSYFDCDDRERTAFELGIKLGALFHQFIGTPVSSRNIEPLIEAMEKTVETQAYVESAKIQIHRPKDVSEEGVFEYTTLKEDMLEAEIEIEYKGIKAVGVLEFIDDIDYPLMYLKSMDG